MLACVSLHYTTFRNIMKTFQAGVDIKGVWSWRKEISKIEIQILYSWLSYKSCLKGNKCTIMIRTWYFKLCVLPRIIQEVHWKPQSMTLPRERMWVGMNGGMCLHVWHRSRMKNETLKKNLLISLLQSYSNSDFQWKQTGVCWNNTMHTAQWS